MTMKRLEYLENKLIKEGLNPIEFNELIKLRENKKSVK